MQNNNSLISFLQAFGILLVVIGHSDYGSPEPLWSHTWIYSFHMPLFMFISGYLLRYGNERRNIHLDAIRLYGKNGFIIKKIKRLLIPYVIISSIALVPKSILSQFAARPIELSGTEYIKMLINPWDNVIIFFWFLPTLFLIFLIAVYGAKLLKGHKSTMALTLLLPLGLLCLHLFNPFKGIRFLNLEGVADYLLYFYMGYRSCEKQLAQWINPFANWISACTFILSVLLLLTPPFPGKDILCATNGITLSLALGSLYQRYQCRFLHHLYGASYAIYLFSWFPQVLSQQVFLKLTGAPWQIASCLAILSGVYIPLWIYKWISRNKEKRFGKIIALLAGHA